MTNILHCDYCGAGYYYHFGQSPYKWKDSDRVTIRYRHTYYHRHTVPCANECKNLSMEALDIMGLVVYRRAMTEQSAELLTEVARDIKRKMDDDALLIQSLEGELKVKLGEIKNFENAIAKGLSPESAIANINRREGEAKAIRESVKAIEEREIQGRKEYSLMMAEFSLSKYQEYINASPKIRLEMFKRILRKATNRDGELSFELIDGRIYKIGYKAFAETYKQIRKDADTLLSVMAEKSSHEEAMAKLKASYAGEKMLKEIAKAFKDNSGHYGEALRDWEYHYIVISYLISKAP